MTSAREFTDRLAALLQSERCALADFLVALADFDRQRLWLDLGHASLFYFLHRELGLSKGAAFYRKTAAELIQKYPDVVEPLRDGRLCLTSVVELSKVLTAQNRAEVLPRFFQLSKREAREVSAAIRPVDVPLLRDVVTMRRVSPAAPALAVAAPRADLARAVHPANQADLAQPVHPANQADLPAPAEPGTWAAPNARIGGCSSDPHPSPPAAPATPPPRTPTSSAEPLTGDLSRLHVTVSRAFLRKLEAARDALSHSHPGASAQDVLEAGLDLLLERHAKRRGKVAKPRREPPPAKPGHVPAHVKRAVWDRDGGRCQWPLAGGGICGSTHRVELDHVVARGRGGPPTIANLRVLCDVHNDLAARQTYGDAWTDRFTRGRRAPARADASATAAPS